MSCPDNVFKEDCCKSKLKEIRKRLRNARQRQKRSMSCWPRHSLDDEECGKEIALPPCCKCSLIVFQLSQQNASVAALYMQMRHKLRLGAGDFADVKRRLMVKVEEAYLETPLEAIVSLLDEPQSRQQRQDLFRAGLFLVLVMLRAFIESQNTKNGLAPSRGQLVRHAISCIPSDLPESVRNRVESHLSAHGRARGQRKWLLKFRKAFGVVIGRLRVRTPMTLAEKQSKVRRQKQTFFGAKVCSERFFQTFLRPVFGVHFGRRFWDLKANFNWDQGFKGPKMNTIFGPPKRSQFGDSLAGGGFLQVGEPRPC